MRLYTHIIYLSSPENGLDTGPCGGQPGPQEARLTLDRRSRILGERDYHSEKPPFEAGTALGQLRESAISRPRGRVFLSGIA